MPAPRSEGEREALSEAWAWRQPRLQGGLGGGLQTSHGTAAQLECSWLSNGRASKARGQRRLLTRWGCGESGLSGLMIDEFTRLPTRPPGCQPTPGDPSMAG